jgi:hypothetical protein
MEIEYEKKGVVGKNLDCDNLANHLDPGRAMGSMKDDSDSDNDWPASCQT